MAEDLAQHLIVHRDIRLAAHMIVKLCLDHAYPSSLSAACLPTGRTGGRQAEGGLDVGPVMIVLQELLPIEGEVVVGRSKAHSRTVFPHSPLRTGLAAFTAPGSPGIGIPLHG